MPDPGSLLTLHHQHASTQDFMPSWNPALVMHTPENISSSQVLSLKHSQKICHVTSFAFLCMNKHCFQTKTAILHSLTHHQKPWRGCFALPFQFLPLEVLPLQVFIKHLESSSQTTKEILFSFMKLLFICTEMKQPDPFIELQDTHPQFIHEDKLTGISG